MAVTLSQARNIAQEFISLIDPHVVKSLIVGSIRRQVQSPGDIDIITQPKIEFFPQKDLWGNTPLNITINYLMKSKVLDGLSDWFRLKAGTKQFQWQIPHIDNTELKLDLWLIPPDEWGVASVIRTGNEWFNKRLMHYILQNRMHVTGQRLHNHPREGTRPETRKGCKLGDKCTRIIPTPDENVFFSEIGLPVIEPTLRTVQTINEYIGDF